MWLWGLLKPVAGSAESAGFVKGWLRENSMRTLVAVQSQGIARQISSLDIDRGP